MNGVAFGKILAVNGGICWYAHRKAVSEPHVWKDYIMLIIHTLKSCIMEHSLYTHNN